MTCVQHLRAHKQQPVMLSVAEILRHEVLIILEVQQLIFMAQIVLEPTNRYCHLGNSPKGLLVMFAHSTSRTFHRL